jgi:hypothetical protein
MIVLELPPLSDDKLCTCILKKIFGGTLPYNRQALIPSYLWSSLPSHIKVRGTRMLLFQIKQLIYA